MTTHPASQKTVLSYTFIFFLTCSIFGTISIPLLICHSFFIKSPNPVSTNLICNLKPSLICDLSLAVLFSAVMLCLQQLPVLCISPVSLMCPYCAPTKYPYYHWNDLNACDLPHSFFLFSSWHLSIFFFSF